MDTFGILIREIINDVKKLEWNRYLIMELINKYKIKLNWKWSMETHGYYGAHTSYNLCATWHPLAILNPWES